MSDTRRAMIFVDGENITFRYQAMCDRGFVPQPNVIHQQDVFVWSPQISIPTPHELIRAYYYTSLTGDMPAPEQVRQVIKGLPTAARHYLTSGSARNLYPVVLKKDRRRTRAKGIDIQMTVEVLTHIHQDHLDTVYLFSGDGDYCPIASEVIRSGKMIYIAAFSDGLNPKLASLADVLVDLDSVFFDLNASPFSSSA